MARKKTPAEVRALIDQGPFSPEDALRAGLVDDLAYEDQLDDRVPELRTGAGEIAPRSTAPTTERVDADARWDSVRGRASRCSTPSGMIVSGKSGFDPVQRRRRRLGHDGRADPARPGRRLDQGDRAARRQSRRVVGRLRRHLARADDHARQETVAAAHRVDVATSRRRAATTSRCRARSSWRSPAR